MNKIKTLLVLLKQYIYKINNEQIKQLASIIALGTLAVVGFVSVAFNGHLFLTATNPQPQGSGAYTNDNIFQLTVNCTGKSATHSIAQGSVRGGTIAEANAEAAKRVVEGVAGKLGISVSELLFPSISSICLLPTTAANAYLTNFLSLTGTYVVPGAPNNVRSSLANKAVSVLWDGGTQSVGFEIYRSPADQDQWKLVGTSTATVPRFPDKDVLPEMAYDYRVRSLGRAVHSPHSATARVAIPANPPLPVLRRDDSKSNPSVPANQLKLSWNNVAIGQGFTINLLRVPQTGFEHPTARPVNLTPRGAYSQGTLLVPKTTNTNQAFFYAIQSCNTFGGCSYSGIVPSGPFNGVFPSYNLPPLQSPRPEPDPEQQRQREIPPVINYFTASPAEIDAGQASILEWDVSRANRCSVTRPNPAGGTVTVVSGAAPKGTISTGVLSQTAEFTINCDWTPTGLTNSAQVTVNVIQPPAPETGYFRAPAQVIRGDAIPLEWNISGDNTCVLSGFYNNKSYVIAPNLSVASQLSVAPPNLPGQNSIFALHCYGAGSALTFSATNTVAVVADSPTATMPRVNWFRAAPIEGLKNKTRKVEWSVSNVDFCSIVAPGINLSPVANSAKNIIGSANTSVLNSTAQVSISCSAPSGITRTFWASIIVR